MLLNCSVCGKEYERNDRLVNSTMAEATGRRGRSICYSCALEEITHGHTPEEGDFNSASFISGEISDKDLGYLMEDLRSVDHSDEGEFQRRFDTWDSIDDPDEEEEYVDWCTTCGRIECICDEDEDE